MPFLSRVRRPTSIGISLLFTERIFLRSFLARMGWKAATGAAPFCNTNERVRRDLLEPRAPRSDDAAEPLCLAIQRLQK